MRTRIGTIFAGLSLAAALPGGVGYAAISDSPTRAPMRVLASEEATALPLAAPGAISRVLGRDNRAYHTRRSASGFTMENLRHGLEARFSQEGVRVDSGTAQLGLAFRAWGYGQALRPVALAAPEARANRVEYLRGPLSEWYVNGPAGLQQGFTLAAPPAARADGPLTLALSLSGPLRPTLEPGGDGLALGGSSLRYRGLLAFDASGRELPARLELRGRTLLIRVDDRGARYPVTIDPFVQQAKLTASDGEGVNADGWGDQLGFSVAVSGDTVVVGARLDDVGANILQGSVYVFVKPASGWANATETAKLTASDGGRGHQFGFSVAVDGDTIVAGAPFDSPDADVYWKGSAYVFVKPASGWANATETAKLTASDATTGDELGVSVGVSASTIVAGAHHDYADNFYEGSVYVFAKPASGWATATESAKLSASDGGVGDELGHAVAVSGDTVVAGSDGQEGSVYVFVEPASGWANASETARLTASDGEISDLLGYSVAVDGDTVVAGAPRDASAFGAQGSAYVFVRPVSGWASTTETAKLTASDGEEWDQLGVSVDVSGDTVVGGAYWNRVDLGGGAQAGAAYVFVKPAAGWADATETEKLAASDRAIHDFFGWSVAVSGATIVTGAYGDDVGANVDQGSAYVFGMPEVLPELLIDDVAATEGSTGTTPAVFTVTLSAPRSIAVTVDYTTADGTALAGSDYVAASGTLTFAPGDTTETITVQVTGDTLEEPDETFFVNLSNAANATLADAQGMGTIVNDESPTPPGAEHDVGIAGGGFRTKGHIDESRNGLGPFTVKIKVKNFGTTSEDVFYAVSSSEAGTLFSSACSGVVADVPPGAAVIVGGCTVTYPGAADPDPVLTLTVTHNDADGGTDSNPANNSRSKAVVINP